MGGKNILFFSFATVVTSVTLASKFRKTTTKENKEEAYKCVEQKCKEYYNIRYNIIQNIQKQDVCYDIVFVSFLSIVFIIRNTNLHAYPI